MAEVADARTIGWALHVFADDWYYRCAKHSPGVYAGWQMIRAHGPMTQGPTGKTMDEAPPLCEVCGADLRDD